METEFDYTLEGAEEDVTLTVEVDYVAHVDQQYGADADGNRGVRAVFVEDVTFVIRDEDGKNITKKIQVELPDDYEQIEFEAQEAAENDAE